MLSDVMVGRWNIDRDNTLRRRFGYRKLAIPDLAQNWRFTF
jgi:hypothetical protein